VNISGVVASSEEDLLALDVVVIEVEHPPQLIVRIFLPSSDIDKIEFRAIPTEPFSKF
jgi:hypothetical protein